jgi:CheY-like chemotaxis protein
LREGIVAEEKRTVLIVDDEKTALFLRKVVLERAGFTVITAPSGQDAIKMLEEVKVDLVLSDILMPSMLGTELARVVKEKNPTLPVVLISGVNEVPPDAFYADAFVSKLDGPAALSEKIQSLLNHSSCTAKTA